jgi:hypothetical protein
VRSPRVIVVPYTRPHEETSDAIAAAGFSPWVKRFVGGSDAAYFELLTELWAAGETFTIVEHDVIPNRDALVSLDDCSNVWCACPYPYLYGQPHVGLGCTRFRAELLTRHPDLMEVVAGMSDRTHPAKHWCRLDAWITNTLRGRGEHRCETHPQVEHAMAQRGSSHGCYVINE